MGGYFLVRLRLSLEVWIFAPLKYSFLIETFVKPLLVSSHLCQTDISFSLYKLFAWNESADSRIPCDLFIWMCLFFVHLDKVFHKPSLDFQLYVRRSPCIFVPTTYYCIIHPALNTTARYRITVASLYSNTSLRYWIMLPHLSSEFMPHDFTPSSVLQYESRFWLGISSCILTRHFWVCNFEPKSNESPNSQSYINPPMLLHYLKYPHKF